MSHNQDLPSKPSTLWKYTRPAEAAVGSALAIAEARRHSKLGVALRCVALRSSQTLKARSPNRSCLGRIEKLTSRSTNFVHSRTAQVKSSQVKSSQVKSSQRSVQIQVQVQVQLSEPLGFARSSRPYNLDDEVFA
ncbi:hypothetical protein H9L39_08823 [Fusarium oxysporum f. sp. albedinis]|nr:hypothetical protein H9L39_08823 [Fusarium oxysporum f. sp. albedinis]